MAPSLPKPSPQHSMPATLALEVAGLVGRWNVRAAELLEPEGLTLSMLETPLARVPLTTMNSIVARARALTGEPGFGFYMGLQRRLSMYGYLGFAMMASSTLRECLELAVQFSPTVTEHLSLKLVVRDEVAALAIDERVDMGDVHDVTILSFVMGIRQVGTLLLGREPEGTAELVIPKPPYFDRFAHLLPNVRFDRPRTQILFDAAMLDLPLVMPDPVAVRLARAQCERALDGLDFDTSIGERVRRALPHAESFRSLLEVAAELHMSPRTLTRRLGAQGLSFSGLLEEARRERALSLLQGTDLPLDEVTKRLGYSTVPNFIRAFHRWTGLTPAAHRRSQRRAQVRAPLGF